jgi:hypothetical protein
VTLPCDEQAPPEQEREPEKVETPRGPEIVPLREPALASATAASDSAPVTMAMATNFIMIMLSR